ncbi:2-oxoacid:acceptor oxidoreductase family protein [Ponticoccus sp. SC2-23]|uniref:2-oxoacid:acceptor oxidoreductase family protein n=1 Tax=Alexandriicola marinus TaxID=2081710 RepID=UPI00193C63DA|nr:2-oxoacid:acceptor oxidoreductase family protein [Alexandriicola marinus]MBM1218739.1 2-oxoacid:acceptor oxidoreductase family protein [Ponticoccus sp. SC6-9]MBM1224189.1 2-oxoacid:acceptor oxidoreductase family protein [Ponticoccus sp. SC6-15]MBM1230032.1 2-oxoacid:acceptor oxidoreductase family protein [Ponticoccus sp. SC6-38]MBM1233155.1 2-oxoacid:acceptor oxidoreductase family protein [Ponticoccus sp. SC6-45]MBM1236895.1 2-oxoacid:acceptor oxidoreductase family protein [Ponticoccus sp. 
MVGVMIEYRIHGRGGQGSVAAAYLLAATAFHAGQMCQAFPAFGAERRGAPVTAFVRTDEAPIRLRAQVRTPHFLIVQDGTLLQDPSIVAGLRPGGGMVVNTTRPGDEVAAEFGCRALTIPATELAEEVIGRPIPNTALLAAFLSVTGLFEIASLSVALRDRFSGTTLERNLALVEKVAATIRPDAWKEPADA